MKSKRLAAVAASVLAAAVAVTVAQGAANRQAATTPGVTATTITIGATYLDWAALKQAGFPVKYREDDPKVVQAYVDYVNKQGGLAGRKIVVKTLKIDALNPNGPPAACLKLTRDWKVFMVLDVSVYQPPASNCVTIQNKTFLWNIYPGSQKDNQKEFPYHMSSQGNDNEELKDTLYAAKRAGFFAIKGKLGLLRWNDPTVWDDPVFGGKKYLKQLGLTNYSEFVADRANPSSWGDAASQALLQFRQQGVTHIMGFTGSGVEKNLTPLAQQQGYKPTWLFADFSTSFTNTLFLNQDNVDGAYGVTSTVLNYKTNKWQTLCSKILVGAGLKPLTTLSVDDVASWWCSAVLGAGQMLKGAGKNLTSASFAAAAQKAGDLPSAQNYGIRFGKGKLTGGDLLVLARYKASCTCWHAIGKPFPAAHTQSWP